MGKLAVLSGKEVCKILARVPVPDHHELKIGTLLSIIRQSGLPRSEFET